MNLIHTCIALSLAGLVSAATVSAQQPAPPAGEHARAKSPDPVSGEILAVDANAKTIVIKTAPDTEMKFSYSDETEIVGGEKGHRVPWVFRARRELAINVVGTTAGKPV